MVIRSMWCGEILGGWWGFGRHLEGGGEVEWWEGRTAASDKGIRDVVMGIYSGGGGDVEPVAGSDRRWSVYAFRGFGGGSNKQYSNHSNHVNSMG